MPAVAAGAVLTGFTTYAAGATFLGLTGITAALAAAGASLVLGGISYALTPKPKSGGGLKNSPGTVAVRQSDLTRIRTYGSTRVIRGYAHITSTNNNKDLHLIFILCEGELRAINEVWINDYCVPNDAMDAQGNVISGRYKGKLQIRKHNGSTSQAADSVAVANIPEWTAKHRLQGIAYLYVKMIKDQDIYPTGVPNVTAIVEAPLMYDPRTASMRWSTNVALFARDFLTSPYGLSSNNMDEANNIAQLNICDEIVAVTPKDYTQSAVTSSVVTLSGDLLDLEYGDQIRVSSTGTVPTGLTAGVDYYVIPYQIRETPRIKLATSLDNSMDRIAVTISSAGTGVVTYTKVGEPRYHGGGSWDTESPLGDVMTRIVNSMAGRAVYIAGRWNLLAGAYRSPSLELTTADMRGPVNWRNGKSLADSFNVVKGLFSGQVSLYQSTDYPAAKYQTFIDQDLGLEAEKDLNLEMVTRPTTAQRVAKIELFKGRQEIACTIDFGTVAMQVQPGDTVELTIPRYGWVQKLFEVTTFDLDVNINGIVCRVGLRETAVAIYDWSNGEAIAFDPAPNTILTNPYLVQVVTGVQYDSAAVETQGGDNVYTIRLLWDEHPNSFVRELGRFEIQYKLSDNTEWLPSFFVDGKQINSDVVTASVGLYYDMRIRAWTDLGVRSEWTTLEGVQVGSSGGVGSTEDWGLVTDSVTFNFDWGDVTDTVGTSIDYGFVA